MVGNCEGRAERKQLGGGEAASSEPLLTYDGLAMRRVLPTAIGPRTFTSTGEAEAGRALWSRPA